MPLRVRLALGFALGTALLIAAVGLGFVLQLRTSLDATLDVGLAGRAATLTERTTPTAWLPCAPIGTRRPSRS
jgi:hypothetical protein